MALEPDLLDQAAAEIRQHYGVQVTTITKDLFKRDAPFELYHEVKATGTQIDVLVNKVQVTASNVIPDELVAANVHSQSAPVDGNESAR